MEYIARPYRYIQVFRSNNTGHIVHWWISVWAILDNILFTKGTYTQPLFYALLL